LDYIRPFLESIRSYEYPELQLYCDEDLPGQSEPIRCRWATGFNLPLYARGWIMAPNAVGTDGLFDVCVFQRGSLLDFTRYFWHVLRGSHIQLKDVQLIRCRRFRIEADGALETPCQIDGDYAGLIPLAAEILPGMLRTLVMPSVAERLGFSVNNSTA
jgi:diacylglycerol kinase family enzyme